MHVGLSFTASAESAAEAISKATIVFISEWFGMWRSGCVMHRLINGHLEEVKDEW